LAIFVAAAVGDVKRESAVGGEGERKRDSERDQRKLWNP
jgi:hypothetical protein